MMNTATTGSPGPPDGLHYGWVIVFVGTLTIVACLGLARFAFGMLLPAMRDTLGMSYDQMGFLGTANFAGYLAAVGVTPLLLRRHTPRKMISSGLLLIAGCTFCIGLSNSYPSILIFYTLVGIGSGFANIPLMVLVSYWFRSDQRGRAAGLIVIGSGFAIIFAGFVIPLLNMHYGADGWRAGWLLIALIVLIIAVIAALLIRNNPAEKGLEPCGRKILENSESSASKKWVSGRQVLTQLGVLYFIFGATYVIYGTFIVTTLIEEYGFAETSAGHFWSWVGFFSLFSGTLFGTLSDRVGRKGGLMVVFGVQTLAYLLAGLKLGTIAIFSSIMFYGIAAFAIPAIMAAAVGDYLGKTRAATGFSLITFSFAIGQTLGPAIAGAVAENSGTFTGSYLCSAALTAAAIIFAAFLPAPEGD